MGARRHRGVRVMHGAWAMALGAALCTAACGDREAAHVRATLDAADVLPESPPDGRYHPASDELELTGPDAARTRREWLARMQVWRRPPAIAAVDFAAEARRAPRHLACRYLPKAPGGTTPKFDCVLPDGQVVKVKYSRTAEIPSEAAATSLLRAMGFGADRVSLVNTVRCFGCPSDPFRVARVSEAIGERLSPEVVRQYTSYVDFTQVSVEWRRPGHEVQTPEAKGWAWWELKWVDPSRGGAPRAEIDALRLMAVFLAHWDNKGENQRLVCEPAPGDAEGCAAPFGFIQDAGATFGPAKADIDGWRAAPVWADRATCEIGMETLPWGGATFSRAPVSEAGRQLLARLLGELRPEQVRSLFDAAGFSQLLHEVTSSRDLDAWVEVFEARAREIVDGAPCPSVSSTGG